MRRSSTNRRLHALALALLSTTLTGAALVLGLPCAIVVLLPAIRAVRITSGEPDEGEAMADGSVLAQAGEGT